MVFIKSVENYEYSEYLLIFLTFFFKLLLAIPIWPAKSIRYIKAAFSPGLPFTTGLPSFWDLKQWLLRKKKMKKPGFSLILEMLSLIKTDKNL